MGSCEGKIGTIGITDYAQGELGDVVFVDIDPDLKDISKGSSFGTIEAVKTVGDLFAPFSGKVTEINKKLSESPEVVNSDPFGEGWSRAMEKPEFASLSERLVDDRRALDAIFRPRNVALVGATEKEGSVGRTILWNMITSPFGGTVFPINPKRQNVMGIKAYASISAVPDPVDLAVIVTPAPSIPGIIAECVEAGVRGAIVISAGFKEVGPAGKKLEDDILQIVRRSTLRVIGPNCLGVMNPLSGLNATFAKGMARPGND